MPKTQIPMVSINGGASSPERIIKYVIDYYFIIDMNSLGSFKKKGVSFKDTVSRIGPDPVPLSTTIKSELTIILQEYFKDVDVFVSIKDDDNKLSLILDATCDDAKLSDALNFVYKNNDIIYDELDNNKFISGYYKSLIKRR